METPAYNVNKVTIATEIGSNDEKASPKVSHLVALTSANIFLVLPRENSTDFACLTPLVFLFSFPDIALFDRAKRAQKRAPRTPVFPDRYSPVLEIRQTLPPCSAAGPLTSCECPVRVLPARLRTHRTGSGGSGMFLLFSCAGSA
ncbi:hypothetical protein LGV61_05760 [Desulfurispirillum indicum]|uniref:hypothetical protein n=1 Tax=Desulfurispirillum indicum TaxID=936456 RepID=UPI001CFBE4A7|nr:hypothetical protein [Desulfurispirillum indicum]UCZ57775.1 hypothetical protein LGV61_05760 [Desulfurispirillum indicum]